ncbi:hypothetical protein B0H19DRAFT_1156151 [Mycena capillaripes]|nr:hypothetical protein B0H19DRAFT_1156151 [Mycena capillaripes]
MSSKKSSSSTKKVEPETFHTRDIVLAKIRGFPTWPGMVVDPETVPKVVSKERPSNKKSVVYAIRFFPAGDYAWLSPKELSHLTAAQINEFVSGAGQARKAGDLMEGYKKALDPAAWEKEHTANPPAAKKLKSKGKASKKDEEEEEEDAAADEDEIEEEAEEEKAGKKRKRASPAPAKAKAKQPKATKAKKGGKAKKSKAAVESEDEAGEEAEAEGEEDEKRASKKPKVTEESSAKLESDPEALKVREWRHKLQKTLLGSNKALPKEEEMPAIDALFTTIEGYQTMSIEYLTVRSRCFSAQLRLCSECIQFSKIGKVMRHINLLEPGKVPRDDEYKFRDRAKALVEKWHGILNANKTTEGESAAVTDDAALNGADVGDLTVMDTNE